MTSKNTSISLPPGLPDGHALVLFDGVCNLCSASVNFIIDRDPGAHYFFASLQSETGQRILRQLDWDDKQPASVVLLDRGSVFFESSAGLHIARKLSGLWPLLSVGLIIPPPVRNLIYRWIASNRYRWFGKTDACRLPTPDLKRRFLDIDAVTSLPEPAAGAVRSNA